MRSIHVAGLVLLWVALWGGATVANVLAGLLVAVAVTAVSRTARAGRAHLRPARALRFAAISASRSVVASLVVAREAVGPRRRTRSGVISVALERHSEAVLTTIADSISLTPGTVTIEVVADPPTILVHVLHLDDVERARQEVRAIEAMVVAAFGRPGGVGGRDAAPPARPAVSPAPEEDRCSSPSR